uniref:Uncharacterized protein n=1 Tax=Anguilla anguilla TaxID=7936 RepID=A0A0E9TIY8_ANGAN
MEKAGLRTKNSEIRGCEGTMVAILKTDFW